MRRFVAAFNAQDPDAACALVEPEFEWRPAYTGGGAVEGNVYRGQDEFRRYLDELVETWGEIEGHIDELRSVGDRVLILAHMRFVGRASGVEMTQPISGVFTFRGEKIASARYYVDRRDALAAVGRGGDELSGRPERRT